MLEENHYVGAVSCKVGDVESVPFWYSCWVGDLTLREAYPKLFLLTSDHLTYVATAGNATVAGWQWNLAVLFPPAAAAPIFLVQKLLDAVQQYARV